MHARRSLPQRPACCETHAALLPRPAVQRPGTDATPC